MSTLQVMAADRITGLAAKLAGLRWSWSISEVDPVVAGLGWRVAHTGEHGVTLDVGDDSVDGYASVYFWQGAVSHIEFLLTRDGDDSPTATAGRQDLLAVALRAVSEAAGPAGDRRPGDQPEIRWRVPGGILRLIDNRAYVGLSLYSAEEADRLDPSPADILDDFDGEDDDRW